MDDRTVHIAQAEQEEDDHAGALPSCSAWLLPQGCLSKQVWACLRLGNGLLALCSADLPGRLERLHKKTLAGLSSGALEQTCAQQESQQRSFLKSSFTSCCWSPARDLAAFRQQIQSKKWNPCMMIQYNALLLLLYLDTAGSSFPSLWNRAEELARQPWWTSSPTPLAHEGCLTLWGFEPHEHVLLTPFTYSQVSNWCGDQAIGPFL